MYSHFPCCTPQIIYVLNRGCKNRCSCFSCCGGFFLLLFVLSICNILNEKRYKFHCVKSVRIRSYSGPYIPAFGLSIQSECGKIRTRITPNTDTFYAVCICCGKYLYKSIDVIWKNWMHALSFVSKHSFCQSKKWLLELFPFYTE